MQDHRRVLVCGGRCYKDIKRVFFVLDRVNEQRRISAVIHGGATGADTYAGEWARVNGIPVEEYKPKYDQYPARIAPKKRNQEMLDIGAPQLVIAFPGGYGTKDMIDRAFAANIGVMREDLAEWYREEDDRCD